MKIVFVYPTFESIGIEYLSAVLKQAGHEVELILDPCLFDDKSFYNKRLSKYFDNFEYTILEIIKNDPQMICFSVCTDTYCWAQKYAKRIKEKLRIPIVFGGVHPSICPEQVLQSDWVDYVVQGEGEYALLELVNALSAGKPAYNIQNVWSKKNNTIVKNDVRPLIRDLDALPFPDKSLYLQTRTDFFSGYRATASRGCPFACNYCYNCFIKKLYKDEKTIYRTRTVDNVIKELEHAKKKNNFNYVVFEDELFPYEENWLKEFSVSYKKNIGLPFSCFVHPLTVNSKRVSLLENAGCASVLMGLDSTSEDFNRNICNRYVSSEDIAGAIDSVKKTKIALFGGYIIGYPGQSKDIIINDLEFYNQHRPDSINVHWIRYFPGTDTSRKLKEQMLITDEIIRDRESQAISNRLRKDLNKQKDTAAFANLFYLMCLLPEWAGSFLMKIRAYNLLQYIYFGSSWAGVLMSSGLNLKNKIMSVFGVKHRNVRFTKRRSFYAYHIFQMLRRKYWQIC